MKILVVDDDADLRGLIAYALRQAGYLVVESADGAAALAAYEREEPALVILDVNLPRLSGFEVCRKIREQSPAPGGTPVMMLTVRGSEEDVVQGLDLGADDYLTKPFGVEELLARVRVALRHAVRSTRPGAIFRTGDLEVDLERRRVTVGGQEVHLTPTEYELLKALIGHPNKVLTTAMLLRWVWGDQYGAGDHYLHVYVARLRKKLASSPSGPEYLVTEPGVGYRLLADE